MRMKSVLATTFLLMIATTGVVHTPESFADHGQGAAVNHRIGHGGSAYSSYIFDGGVDCKFTAAKAPSVPDSDRIGHGDLCIPTVDSHRTQRRIVTQKTHP